MEKREEREERCLQELLFFLYENRNNGKSVIFAHIVGKD